MPRNFEEYLPKKELEKRLNKEIILEQLIGGMDISQIINVLNKMSLEDREQIKKFLH